MNKYLLAVVLGVICLVAVSEIVTAQGLGDDNGDDNGGSGNNSTNQTNPDVKCSDLGFSCDDLKRELSTALSQDNGGVGFNVWAAAVDRRGYTCCVVYSGNNTDSQWGASRVLSVAKAFTANSFSLPELALSTGNLYSLVQGGNLLNGMDHNHPVRAEIAYDGSWDKIGQGDQDPLYGKRLGGLVAYGGGLGVYKCSAGLRSLVGAIAVDGDTSCADHAIAWRIRHALNGDYIPGGVHSNGTVADDNLIYLTEQPSSGFAHPRCTSSDSETLIRDGLPLTQTCI